MSIIDLNMARVEREEDNEKVSVAELLRLALKDVTSGEIANAKRAVILVVREGADKSWKLESYRCGLNRPEEIGLLTTFVHERVEDWIE